MDEWKALAMGDDVRVIYHIPSVFLTMSLTISTCMYALRYKYMSLYIHIYVQ